MMNLFEGVRKMTDDEIRMQIALFRNVTLLNAAKETSGKVLGGLADIANAFAESFSKRTPFDFQVTRVCDMVRKEYDRLKANDRVQLEYELKKILTEKCRELVPEESEEPDEERLSFLIINEAAKVYGIHKYKTPSGKIEAVSTAYNNALLSVLHTRLQKQGKEEVIHTDQKIQDAMNAVSLDTKRQLQSALMPKEFSGRCIGRILRLERSTKYLSYTVTFLGYGCFDEVLYNVSAVFSAMRAFKRISRVLFAQMIWKIKNTSHLTFTIAENVLPAYLDPVRRQEFMIQEQEFRAALAGRIESEQQYAKCEQAVTKQEEKAADAKQRLELMQRDYDELQMKFMGLESRKDEYMNRTRPENETKDYYSEVNETKRRLDRAQAQLSKAGAKYREEEEKRGRAESEKNTAMLNLEVVKRKTEEEVRERAREIEKVWKAFFFRFSFEEDLFESVVIHFTRDEVLIIEEMLKELHESRNTGSFAYETKQEEDHTESVTYTVTPGEKVIRIVYEKTHIMQIG